MNANETILARVAEEAEKLKEAAENGEYTACLDYVSNLKNLLYL